MSTLTGGHGGHGGIGRKSVLRVLLGTGAVLLVPLLAMQFTREVNWTASDFAVASVLLASAGFALEFALHRLGNLRQRLPWVTAIALVFVYAWAELAVGIFFHFGS